MTRYRFIGAQDLPPVHPVKPLWTRVGKLPGARSRFGRVVRSVRPVLFVTYIL